MAASNSEKRQKASKKSQKQEQQKAREPDEAQKPAQTKEPEQTEHADRTERIEELGNLRVGKTIDAPTNIRGVNLSGWLILEPWITPSLFTATGASNDLGLQQALGDIEYSDRLRQHLETFITEEDFRRISAMGLNAVRLPVPWHAFGVQTEGFSHIPCIDYIDRAFEWGEKYGVSVLLDLATVPGGQGDSNDSPTTPDKPADWHSSTDGRKVALDVLEQLAKRYGEREGLLGIELLDTPILRVRKNAFSAPTVGIPPHYLRNYYRDAYKLLRGYMPEQKIIVFSASGHPDAWKGFLNKLQYKNVYMDVHLYHYRDENARDIASPQGLSGAINRNKKLIAEAKSAGFPVIVGEWSAAAVISGSSVTPEGRRAYERVFVSNQLATFDEADGWYFQTWKTERRIEAWDARVTLAPFEREMLD